MTKVWAIPKDRAKTLVSCRRVIRPSPQVSRRTTTITSSWMITGARHIFYRHPSNPTNNLVAYGTGRQGMDREASLNRHPVFRRASLLCNRTAAKEWMECPEARTSLQGHLRYESLLLITV